MGDNDAVRGKVKTLIPLILRGVTEEDTLGRVWSELVGSDGREVGVAGTPEDTNVCIGGSGAKEGKVARGGGDCFGREEVEEIGGGVKALNPVASWMRCLQQQGAHDIVGGANHALGLAILRGGVRAWHSKLNAVGEEEGARVGVIEVSSVIALDTVDGVTKLLENVGEKVREGGESAIFEAQ
jgi:hypothetical protein